MFGFLYYLYNEVAFLALPEVAPVTHAVTNTVKRVVIILALASVVVFRTPVSPLGMVGAGVAIVQVQVLLIIPLPRINASKCILAILVECHNNRDLKNPWIVVRTLHWPVPGAFTFDSYLCLLLSPW